MKERIRLPVDSALAQCSFDWAVELLGEAPLRLRVSLAGAPIGSLDYGLEVTIDPSLSRWSWVLEGDTKEVYSDGG